MIIFLHDLFGYYFSKEKKSQSKQTKAPGLGPLMILVLGISCLSLCPAKAG